MIERCTNPRASAYKTYGGAGVRVTRRWRVFENFLADMGERPHGKTLDRINGEKGYEPGNCRWATWREQQRNRKSNRRFLFQNQHLCVVEIAERIGVQPNTLYARIAQGIRPPRLFESTLTPSHSAKFLYENEMLTVAEISARSGIKKATLYFRLRRGTEPPELYAAPRRPHG